MGKININFMWELHLRNRLLRILERYRLNTGERLTRQNWLELALKDRRVKLHHPILACRNNGSFRRKVDKTLNPCIPPHDGFAELTREQKSYYYVTFEPENSEQLEITQKGNRFIDIGGYTQRLYELYSGPRALVIWLISLVLAFLFGKKY